MTARLCSAVALVALTLLLGPPDALGQEACGEPRAVPGVRDAEAVSSFMTGTPVDTGLRVSRVSYLNYNDLAPRLNAMALAGFQRMDLRVAGRGRPERTVRASFVTASYFDVLGVRVQAGRAFTASHDEPASTELVAVISGALWESLFDRDPAAVGRTIAVNGHDVTIAGIADPPFHGLDQRVQDALWLPGVILPVVSGVPTIRADDRARGGYYEFVGRLAPGATWEDARHELAAAMHVLVERYPLANSKFTLAGFHQIGPITCGTR